MSELWRARLFIEVPDDDRTIEGVGVWECFDGRDHATLRRVAAGAVLIPDGWAAAVKRMLLTKRVVIPGRNAAEQFGFCERMLGAACGEGDR